MAMGAKEPGLTPETMVSVLMGGKVHQLGEKFVLVASIYLKVPGKSEQITNGTTMRVSLHEDSMNTGHRIPMLSVMANLLPWYNLCQCLEGHY